LKSTAFKTILITVVFTVFGFFFLPYLRVNLSPSTTRAKISILYDWKNASPQMIESQISSVLENAFSTLQGIEKISSVSSIGSGYIELELKKNFDQDVLRFETASIIRQVFPKLPLGTSYPTIVINKSDEDLGAFVSYSVSSDDSSLEILEQLQLHVMPKIGVVKGVDRTQIYGAEQKEIVIRYCEDILNLLDISKDEIITALQNYFNNQSLGDIKVDNSQIALSLVSKAPVNWHIPLINKNGRIIFLDDIAEVFEQEQEPKMYFRVNGKNAVNVLVFAKNNANIMEMSPEIDTIINETIVTLNNNLEIKKNFDKSIYLKRELHKTYNRFITSTLLLLLLVYVFSMDFRYVVHIVFGIIASLSLAFIGYYYFKVEIQLYSLAGLTISLGLVLDNIIVMLDHLKKQSNTKVFKPILASTLTSIASLSLIYFLEEQLKLYLIDFAWIIIINLSVSLIVVRFIMPALWYLYPVKSLNNSEKSLESNKVYMFYLCVVKKILNHKRKLVFFIILLFGFPIFLLPNRIDENDNWYNKLYNSSYGNEWFQEEINYYLKKYLGGTFRLFSVYVFENFGHGVNEETILYLQASMEKGANIYQMNEAMIEIERFLSQFNEIKSFTTYVHSSDFAKVEIMFKEEFEKKEIPFLIKAKISKKTMELSGMTWEVYGVGKGFKTGNSGFEDMNFSLKARGYNYEELSYWSDSLVSLLKEEPRVLKAYVKDNSSFFTKPRIAYRLNFDLDKLSLSQSNLKHNFQQIEAISISKHPDFALTIDGRYVPVRLESKESKNFDFWKMFNTPFFNEKNSPLKLNQIAKKQQLLSEESICKEQQEYIRRVEIQYAGSEKFGNILLDEALLKLKTSLPIGYYFEKENHNSSFSKKIATNYFFLILLVVLIIYIICSVLFESLTQSFVIISIIPISYIGVFLAFFCFNFSFDQGGMVSFVLLSGITVNACIFILDEYNNQLKSGNNNIECFCKAFWIKIFPVSLTIITTIVSFIPFVIGKQNEVFWQALGIGTIGGLIFSLIGVFIFLPLFSIKQNKN
jgi:multidrug efflux pump subunit AcrB